jgi:hypothetical protein
VPAFWINVDASVGRASTMRAQLAEALLPGAVATRVPASLIGGVRTTVKGDLLFKTNTSELLFGGPSTHHLEIAVMASHIKAILWGSRLGTSRDKASLLLEDDVDLLFFPRVRGLQTGWLTAQLTADGLRRALPADWSFAQLFATAHPTRWRATWEAWRTSGRAPAVYAETVTYGRKIGCSNRMQSAGAYFVRGSTAVEVLEKWPAHEKASGAFRLYANRTCFNFRAITGLNCKMEDHW